MRRGRLIPGLALLLALAAAPSAASAATSVSGEIAGSKTWSSTGSPYVLTDNATLAAGARLTIKPGVRVESTGRYRLNVVGRLSAVGTPADPIDLAIGSGLRFYDGSAGSEIAWATVRDSLDFGVTTEPSAPWPSVHDVEFRNNEHAAYLYYPAGGTGSVTDSRFIGNFGAIGGAGGDYSFDRVLVQDSSYQSANLVNNADPWNGLRQRWTFTRSNLLPPTNPSCSYGGRCTVHVGGSGYPIDAVGNWWGTTDTSEIDRLIYDGKDDPGTATVDHDSPALSPFDLYAPASTISIPAGSYQTTDLGSIAGGATDDGPASSEIAEVRVSLRDLSTNRTWDGAGWVSGERFRVATGTDAWSIAIPALVNGHRYALRSLAEDAAGNVQWGASSATFTADGSPPTVTAPAPSLLAGSTLGIASLPVTLEWSGTDNLTPNRVLFDLDQRAYRDGAWEPWSPVRTGTTARSTSRLLDLDVPYGFRVRASDVAGNTSGYKTESYLRARPTQEASPTVTYTGLWTPRSDAGASGRAVRYTTTPGSSATFSFLGRSIAVVMPRRAELGVVEICLDRGTSAESCETADLAAGALGARRMVFTRNALDPAVTHTVDVMSVSGRADLDAFVTLR